MSEPIHGTQPVSPIESHSGIRKSLVAAQDRAQDALAHAAQKVRHASEDATLATPQALHGLMAKAKDGLDSFELSASHALEDSQAKAKAKAKAIRDHDSSAVLSAAKAGEAVAGDRAQKSKDSK